jgi:hypothetical protein
MSGVHRCVCFDYMLDPPPDTDEPYPEGEDEPTYKEACEKLAADESPIWEPIE